ncbi:MAG TPA: hypothetical protein VN285_09540 [Candidatus Deferrimicrobium sp.]|nr:hypothetical protein [Candidatus Deferrimicrobium sp.]
MTCRRKYTTWLLTVLLTMLGPLTLSASIVNNSTTSPTSEDSVSFVFYSLDSLGNPTTADSVYILVSGPTGTIVYKDSILSTNSRITSTTVRGKQFYSFADQVSNLDGSGAHGHYAITLLTKRNSGNLQTPNVYSFQIISKELSDQIAKIADSVYVKGGAVDSNRTEMGGSGDSASVARWVWNTPHGNHVNGGTFGKYLDTEVSGISGGSGAYSFTLVTYDSTIDQVIPLAGVAVRNVSQSALIASGKASSAGTASFNLNGASYVVIATAPGYIFKPYDTVVVSGTGTDTLFGDQFDPGAPASPELCRVYGFVYDLKGQPEEGASVTAYLPSGVARITNGIVSPYSVSASTDTAGYFFLDLIPSNSLSPSGAKYELTISRTDGTILRQRVAVPDSTQWRLTW